MGKTRLDSAKVERVGVLETGLLVQRELDWIFREQATDDYGIDAQIEVVDGTKVTGRLLAAQIKSGKSYFKPTAGGWWFYVDPDDLEYWIDHSLPVIVVCYEPNSGKAFWESVEPSKIVKTRKGRNKLLIPQSKQLCEDSKGELTKLAEGKPYELRLRRLRLALPWMKLLVDGRRLLLESDEWVHKTSGRGDLAIVSVDESNEDRKELGSWLLWGTSERYENILPSLVPWADVVPHEETYDAAEDEAPGAECARNDMQGDPIQLESLEGGREHCAHSRLRPYGNSAGEVDHWRLELTLNELGLAFLRVNDFAEGRTPFLTP